MWTSTYMNFQSLDRESEESRSEKSKKMLENLFEEESIDEELKSEENYENGVLFRLSQFNK